MPIVAAIAVALTIIWGWIFVTAASFVVACGLYLVLGSVVGYEFFNFEIAGISMSADRFILLGLVAAYGIRRFLGLVKSQTVMTSEVVLLAFLGLLIANTFWHDWRTDWFPGQVPIIPHLIEGYLIPLALYWIARRTTLERKGVDGLYCVLALFGIYLALTALCEIFGMWGLVYPRYIADPEIGIHYGRARGPFLQSVRMGIYLFTGLACTWIPLVWRQCWGRHGRILGICLAPLFLAALAFTYTRSIWLGVALASVLLFSQTLSGRWRKAMLFSMLLSSGLLLVTLKGSLVSFQREYGAAETAQSTEMRTVFAYVSWIMFQDRPLAGFGFGQFPRENIPYLDDRSTKLPLDFIRGYIHHNTFLSLLVELGLFGLLLFSTVLVTWGRNAWQLWKDLDAPDWMRGHGLLFLLFLTGYVIQMMFHEVSYSVQENGLLFLLAGVSNGLALSRKPAGHERRAATPRGRIADTRRRRQAPVGAPSAAATRVRLFGVEMDAVTMPQAVDKIFGWIGSNDPSCRYVVTPNVDHAVMLRESDEFRGVYGSAALVVADGWPVVTASRLLGRPLPERVAGSDLVPTILKTKRLDRDLRVYLLGAMPGVADRAAGRIRQQYPGVDVVGTYSPPRGFESDDEQNQQIIRRIAEAKPDVLVIGLGAPKQELWVKRHQPQLRAKVALCVGATIDFLAGEKERAPVWVQALRMEWLHRMASEPKRLCKRYARDAWIFPQMVWQEWRRGASRQA